MGKIIQFSNENTDDMGGDKKRKYSLKKIIGIIIASISTFCTISGITVCMLVGRDWQKIAEQYNNEGLELYNLGEYEEAIALYNKAIGLESKGIEDIEVCYYNRGRAYFKLGNYQKAIGDYSIAIEISPQQKYYSDRAVTYEMLGENEKAMIDNIQAVATLIE